MKALRILSIVFIFTITQVIISSCTYYSFSYTVDGMILENLKNEEVTSDQDIAKAEYGIKINFLGQKHYRFGKNSSNNAMACDMFYVYPHDRIYEIRIKALGPDTSTEVTDGFLGCIGSFYGEREYESISSLIEDYNYQRDYVNEIYLKPSDSLPLEGYLKFVVEIYLQKSPTLTDTTNVVKIY
ncbi:MAG TPA: hypothetical protein PKH02_07355 [Bacteroidales bacterium]|nr:hypothetical protein [Bacteroidales bacterium]HPT12064.1 hypothetical protein [Bacteroidales bacterium]